MRVLVTNIEWDCEPGVDLPRELTVDVPDADEETVSEHITSLTGFCHFGFSYRQEG